MTRLKPLLSCHHLFSSMSHHGEEMLSDALNLSSKGWNKRLQLLLFSWNISNFKHFENSFSTQRSLFLLSLYFNTIRG